MMKKVINSRLGTRPATVTDVTAKLAQTGAIPVGAVTQPELIQQNENQIIDTGTGEVGDATACNYIYC